MKSIKTKTIWFLAAFVFFVNPLLSNAQKRLFVLSDPHLIAKGLFQSYSSAFQNALANDNKMFDLSNEIMQSVVNTILEEQPDAVLIPGDLTKQGAKLSHIEMSTILKQITDAGIKVFVIPGNHDVNNTQAVRYDGNNTYPAATVTSSEFVELYNEMGFANALARDNNSLSYVVEPIPGLRLIAVDDSRCTARDNNPYLNANGLTMSTRSWICNQIDDARQHDKQVMVMMHHNLIEHIDEQSSFTGDARLTLADAVRDEMLQHGARFFLTGHMHISNISTWYNEELTDSVVEISTGSAIAYPCHYRIIEVSPDLGTFTVTTHSITDVEGIENFPEYALERMNGSTRATISSIVYNNWDALSERLEEYQSYLGNVELTPENITNIAYRNMSESVSELNQVMAEGNENEKDGQAIRNRLNTAITNFANDILSDANIFIQLIAAPLITEQFNQMLDVPLKSALNDCTNYGSYRANVTDDLHPILHFTSVEIPSDTIRGDLNGDTIVDVSDVNILINIILGYETNNELIVAADLTGDNLPDVSDVNALINIILHKD